MNYGKVIKTLRKLEGLSQKDLATSLQVQQSFISLLERSQRIPTTGLLDNLSRVFEVPVFVLVLMASEEKDLSKNLREIFVRNLVDLKKPKINLCMKHLYGS